MTDALLHELERCSFKRLIKPLLEHDSSIQPKARSWWIDHAKRFPAWLEEDLLGVPDDQKDELRALVQEAV